MMSADFPGEARNFVEKIYNEETKVLFLQGCAGDIRPNLKGTRIAVLMKQISSGAVGT